MSSCPKECPEPGKWTYIWTGLQLEVVLPAEYGAQNATGKTTRVPPAYRHSRCCTLCAAHPSTSQQRRQLHDRRSQQQVHGARVKGIAHQSKSLAALQGILGAVCKPPDRRVPSGEAEQSFPLQRREGARLCVALEEDVLVGGASGLRMLPLLQMAEPRLKRARCGPVSLLDAAFVFAAQTAGDGRMS